MGTTKGATTVRFRVLGQIEAGDEPSQALGGPTQRRVFAALVARRNESVSIGELVEICWPDGDAPERAEHNVRTYVHRLRTALGDESDRIQTSSGGYRLVVEPGDLDIDRFDELAAGAGRLIDTGDLAEALDRSEDAEGLWRGRPYGEFADEPWAIAEVARLTEVLWSMHERRAEALMTAGRPGDAVASLESMIADEPLRERPRALLMRAMYESGRHAEALRAFQDFRRLLIDEVGVDPSPDLVELDRAIASGGLETSQVKTRTVGNYELHERIGEGAFAVVHRATQSSLGREVAIKIVRAELANRPDFIRRFEAEAQMVAAIEHPSVVPLYDYWREPDQAFLVMRWMTGGSLETRLDDGPWSLDATLELVDQIAAALTASHQHGVVHRDVKPANILFDDAGRAYLGDFGIALTAAERATPRAALSEGSPVFASPEQLRREPVGPEADVHALAIVAFNALSGHTPFADSPDEATMLRRQLDESIPPISTVVPGLPVVLDAVLATATAKRPGDRYPAATEFAAAFRAAASGDGAIQSARPLGQGRVNPYLGLRAFSESDADAFYGRDRLTEELLSHLATPDQNMLAVVGPSGSGKSSVVRAGLIPALRGGRVPGSERWFTTTMVPGSRPFEALETALLRVAVNPPGSLLEQLRDGDRGILRGIRRILPDDDGVVVVVIDQFEEVFTTDVSEIDRDQFLRALAVAATEPGSTVRIVLTLRADFYDEPLRHPEFAPLVKRHTLVVTPLAPDELEEAITRPAGDVGVGFEPGLVAEVAADVNSQPGALPLLQFALTQGFDQSDGPTITVADYRAIGGLSGALALRAEDVWQECEPVERDAARRLFGRLVTLGEGTEDTRRRVGRSELPTDSATDAVIDRFGRARLLTFDHSPATREPTVEVAHEALIREWQRLRNWLDDDRDALRIHRHLTVAAAGWTERDRDPNELYRGARVDVAAPLLDNDTVSLNETEADFLSASVRLRDEEAAAERVRVRRLHRLVVGTAIVAVAALIAGAVALRQWSRADDQAALAAENEAQAVSNAEQATANEALATSNAERAESNAVEAETNAERAAASAALAEQRAGEADAAREQGEVERLRAVALATAPERPVVAALLAVEAQRMDPSIESLDTLHRVLTAVPGMKGAVPAIRYSAAELLDDQTTMVAAGTTLDVWDVADRVRLSTMPIAVESVRPLLDVSADGRTAVVAVGVSEVAVFDLAANELHGAFTTAARVNDVSLSRDGKVVAVGQDDGLVTLWDAVALDERAIVESGESSVRFSRWNPADDSLTLVTLTSTVQVWDVNPLELRWASTPNEGFTNTLSVNPNGVVHTSDGTLVVVDSGQLSPIIRSYHTVDGTQPYPATSRTDGANGLGLLWIDEELRLVGAANSKGVATYDLTTGEEAGEFVGEVNLEDVVYSPRRHEIVAVGSDRLQFRSILGDGPLERVVLLSDEQREAVVGGGGTVHPSISSDGSRLVVSTLNSFEIAPTTSFDLMSDPMTADDFPFDDRLPFGHDELTMTFDLTPPQFELLDSADLPIATIPLTFDMTDQDVSADGRFIVIARTGGLVDLYDGTGNLLKNLDMNLEAAELASIVIPSLTDNGEFVHATTNQGANAVWSTDTFDRIDDGSIQGQSRLVGNVLVHRRRNNVQTYELPSLAPVGPVMINESGGMFYPAIDSQSQRLAVTSQNSVTVYDMASGKQLGSALPYRPIRVEFTEDGTQLAVGGQDRVTIWNYDTESWPAIACGTAGRNLSREEWEQLGPRDMQYRATCPEYPTEG